MKVSHHRQRAVVMPLGRIPFVKAVQGIIFRRCACRGCWHPPLRRPWSSLYRQAHEAVRANDQVRSASRARLIHYPLLPYLDYYQLAFRPGAADYNDVTRFIRQHGDTPVQPARAQLSHLSCLEPAVVPVPASIRPSQAPPICQLSALSGPATFTGHQSEALQEAGKLWLSGQSRPDACDPLFQLWQQAGLRTQEKIWGAHEPGFRGPEPQPHSPPRGPARQRHEGVWRSDDRPVTNPCGR